MDGNGFDNIWNYSIIVGGLLLVGLGIGLVVFLVIAIIIAILGFIFYFFMGSDGFLIWLVLILAASKIPDEFIAACKLRKR